MRFSFTRVLPSFWHSTTVPTLFVNPRRFEVAQNTLGSGEEYFQLNREWKLLFAFLHNFSTSNPNLMNFLLVAKDGKQVNNLISLQRKKYFAMF